TGPSSDLQVSTNLARAMVTRWGMSDVIGPVALAGKDGMNPYAESNNKEHSEHIATKVDEEISRIINDGLVSAEKVLKEHQKAFVDIAKKLIEVETLEQEEYEKILTRHGIELKKKDSAIDTEKKA
ncbi:MAG: cell division protein FtsH, partial [Candidatus Pacebacteria bacterium]|nr:cell division protein FtsH [Candidatus Paceibacterota bacterium]